MSDDYVELENSRNSNSIEDFNLDDLPALQLRRKTSSSIQVTDQQKEILSKLLEMGYTKVYNLYGGIFDWKNQSQIVVNHLNLPTDSIHAYSKLWSTWLHKGIKVYE